MTATREGSVAEGDESQQQPQTPVPRDVRSQTPNIIILDRRSADRLSLSPYRDTRREKSPFEIGSRKETQIASTKAVIDKAAIMDITGVTSRVAKSVDEFIQFYVNDYCIIDKASILDISPASVKIVIVEEDEEEEEDEEPVKETTEITDEDKKKLRWKRMEIAKNPTKKVVIVKRAQGAMKTINRKDRIVKKEKVKATKLMKVMLQRRRQT